MLQANNYLKAISTPVALLHLSFFAKNQGMLDAKDQCQRPINKESFPT